ncbi:MAG: 5'-methylthioadenosine/adenosylhomocysteine nucleosidase [Bacillota bacterium]
MTVGIMGALDVEIAALLEQMPGAHQERHSAFTYHQGKLKGRPVALVRSGVGKVAAAACAQSLMDVFGATRVVFTGLAGALDERLRVGDVVIATELVQHDVDVTAFGYAPGEVPCPGGLVVPTDPALTAMARQAALQTLTIDSGRLREGRILTGDQFVVSREKVFRLREEFQGLAVEMEGAAVAQVCAWRGVPCAVIRAISDTADGQAPVDFRQFQAEVARISAGIVLEMLKLLPL